LDLLNQYNSLEEEIKKKTLEKEMLIQKGLDSTDPGDLVKAQELYAKNLQDSQSNPNLKSYLYDPMFYAQNLGFKDKPLSLSYDTLRRMAKAPIIKSIIETRIEQVSAFSDVPANKYSTGFVIRKKGVDQKTYKPTREDKRKIKYLTDFIGEGGSNTGGWLDDDFDTFLRKYTADSLILDQATFEPIRTRKGDLVSFKATDGATFRFADHNRGFGSQIKKQGYLSQYVQLYQGRMIQEFWPWELCFAIRNPTTNIHSNGYGNSELEDLINIVTSMLFADQYNRNVFSQGSMPKGLMRVKGNVPQAQLEQFRAQWMATMAGVQNSHKIPIVNAEEMEFIDMQKTNKEMEYAKYQEYLIKLSCAIYKIDPSEINFSMSGNSQGTSGLGGDNHSEKIKFSREKGLKPILKFHQKKLNKYLIAPQEPEFELVFVGMEAEDAENEQDMRIKSLNYKTFNEVRAEENLPGIEGGDVIGNPVFMQGKQMSLMGGQDSNQFMDDQDNENPFSKKEDDGKNQVRKSANPIMDDFMNFMEDLKKEK
jgi:hypothetical protein